MRAVLIFIGVAYAVIAAAYAVTIPFGQAPDESAHLPYVAYLADHGRLPVFRQGAGSYEFHQPPLYYAAALGAYLLGRSVAAEHAYLALRLFGVMLGLAVIYLTYLLVRDFRPGQPWLAVGSAGLVAFLPMHVALSASVTNDIAAEVPFAAGLWQMVVAARDGWSWRRTTIIGALCGLAALGKSSAIILLPAAWLAVALAARDNGATGVGDRNRLVPVPFRVFAGRAAALTGVALVVCGWWLVRNQMLYGDPFAWRVFMQAFANTATRHSPAFARLSDLNYALLVGAWTFASFWGVFGTWAVGTRPVFLPAGIYIALAAVTLAALVGAALEAREWTRWDRWRNRVAWALLMAAILVAASFVRFNLSFFQAQGRYLFLALPVIAMVLAAGWGRLFPQRRRNAAYAVLWLAMMGLSAAALPVWILPHI